MCQICGAQHDRAQGCYSALAEKDRNLASEVAGLVSEVAGLVSEVAGLREERAMKPTELNITGMVDEKKNIRYISNAFLQADGKWLALADVEGALCRVEVKISPSVVPTPICSPRGIPLVISCDPAFLETNSLLTVELHGKWYSLFLIRPGRLVEAVPFPTELCIHGATSYSDHVPNPCAVEEWAKAHKVQVDAMAMELMVGRWRIEAQECETLCGTTEYRS